MGTICLPKPKSSDFSLPVPDVMFWLVAASFRLHNLRETLIYAPDEEKLRLKPEATIYPCNQTR